MDDLLFLSVLLLSLGFNLYLSARVWWLKRRLEAEKIFQTSLETMVRMALEQQAQRRPDPDEWPDALDGRSF